MKFLNENKVSGIVTCDEHSPFTDLRAIELACKIIKYISPDVLINNGDQLDFYKLSSFKKSPERKETIQDELDFWENEIISRYKEAYKGNLHFKTEGNHEKRLNKYFCSYPELFGLDVLRPENLLRLKENNIINSPDGVLINDSLAVFHGESVSKHSTQSVKSEMENQKYCWNVITGHVHRVGKYVVSSGKGENLVGVEGGSLCNMNPEYISGRPNWQHGIVYFEAYNNEVFIQPILFNNYSAVFGRRKFSA